jgi:hypothetical protein
VSAGTAGRVRGWLWRSPVLPGVLIAAMVVVALLSTEPTSGIDVYVRLSGRPYRGLVTLTRRGAHEVVTGHRAGADGHFRLLLAPGFYVLHPVRERVPGVPSGRDIEVHVLQNRFSVATVVFHRRVHARHTHGRAHAHTSAPRTRAGGTQAPPAGP